MATASIIGTNLLHFYCSSLTEKLVNKEVIVLLGSVLEPETFQKRLFSFTVFVLNQSAVGYFQIRFQRCSIIGLFRLLQV